MLGWLHHFPHSSGLCYMIEFWHVFSWIHYNLRHDSQSNWNVSLLLSAGQSASPSGRSRYWHLKFFAEPKLLPKNQLNIVKHQIETGRNHLIYIQHLYYSIFPFPFCLTIKTWISTIFSTVTDDLSENQTFKVKLLRMTNILNPQPGKRMVFILGWGVL